MMNEVSFGIRFILFLIELKALKEIKKNEVKTNNVKTMKKHLNRKFDRVVLKVPFLSYPYNLKMNQLAIFMKCELSNLIFNFY